MNLKRGLNWCLSLLSFRLILHCSPCFHVLASVQHFFFLLNLLPWIFFFILFLCFFLYFSYKMRSLGFYLYNCSCILAIFGFFRCTEIVEFQIQAHLMTRKNQWECTKSILCLGKINHSIAMCSLRKFILVILMFMGERAH